ncbi:ABC transporter substrate-binding protein [Verrucomicrobiaceae bacterium R5-34]|uniref:ABC transporter substrate-binding protein n=1 Tax=Oceaniferula flava TaxID=2800421 RepID=A0AAE2SAC0_9BACT|nr:helical backbone metal receptor [Oceaniferula flavus]MBK1832084.1 ABC transporter substrate-binding protein [Verrucomicrobiaceae bacterium R5-34]MBK1854168.1 ABC transporter substrate-binding protein [Oceaniferula flavus]MBM1135474.1 ABC transporter substrate-binding protein [Oceaniferula flavus]
MNRTIYCEAIDHYFILATRPARVVSLLPFATETLHTMGLADSLVGASEYCRRYVPELEAPVVGQYVYCDIDKIKVLKPSLILTTNGIQRNLANQLAREGLPVFVLPLPQSFYGILENIRVLGRLMNQLEEARTLTASLTERVNILRQNAPARRPRVYVEIWVDGEMHTVGGGSYIQDLVDIAGGDLIYRDNSTDYLVPDFDYVASQKPDVYLFFHEPEYELNAEELIFQRQWDMDSQIILSTVTPGKNIIQDGPSILDTAEWLHQQLHA